MNRNPGYLSHNEESNFGETVIRRKSSTKITETIEDSEALNVKNLKEKGHIIFPERNLIKKVKTFSINYFIYLIQNCVEDPKLLGLYNMKNKKKRKNFRLFKSDISKIRNFFLFDVPMKDILETFACVQFSKIEVKPEKIKTFNYFMNMTWGDFILFCKRNVTTGNKENSEDDHEITSMTNSQNELNKRQFCSEEQVSDDEDSDGGETIKKNKFLKRKISCRDYKEYISYIKQADYNYGNRANVNRGYLKIFDSLKAKYSLTREEMKLPFSNLEFLDFIFDQNTSDYSYKNKKTCNLEMLFKTDQRTQVEDAS